MRGPFLTPSAPRFEIVGSTAELYPPSKTPLPKTPTTLWDERRVQQRWLLNSHPEATPDSHTVSEFLKEDMERFAKVDDGPGYGPLLEIGEMTDLRASWDPKGMPLLAVAAGESGEQVRLARMNMTKWQWANFADATLNLSVVDRIYQEEETLWSGDGLPVTRIMFASSHSPFGSTRWLVVQTRGSTTILQPEYHPVPGNKSDQPLSYIKPNPIFALRHDQTGGNAHADVCFVAPALGSPAQICVVDECGYWSLWSILGILQVGKNTLRPTLEKYGQISEGVLGDRPAVPYPAERHGILRICKNSESLRSGWRTKAEHEVEMALDPSLYVLLWNAKNLKIMDMQTDLALPALDLLLNTQTQNETILDVQISAVDSSHVFVLTTQRLVWVDVLDGTGSSEAQPRPRIILACPHFGIDNSKCMLSVCQASEDDKMTSLAFVYSPDGDQVAVYWFGMAAETSLPQWSRFITSLASTSPSATLQLLHAHPVTLEASPGAEGPGSEYQRAQAKFYQVNILSDNLSVQYCICVSLPGVKMEVSLPTNRVGWSKSDERKRWKKKRRHFLRHLGDTFVVGDGMTDAQLAAALREHGATEEDAPPSSSSAVLEPHPVRLKYDRIFATTLRHLALAAPEGLPANLASLIQEAIDVGEAEGKLPLKSWADIVANSTNMVSYDASTHGVDADIERLLETSNERISFPPLISGFAAQSNPLPTFAQVRDQIWKIWLESTQEIPPEDKQRIRAQWVENLARNVFLSSRGVLVLPEALKPSKDRGPSASVAVESSQSRTSRSPGRSQSAVSSSPSASSDATHDAPDAAIQRLQLLAPSLKPGKLGTLKQSKTLSYWPEQRGVDIQDYMSSVAIASDDKFVEARQRLHRIEAKRKALEDKYKRPLRQTLQKGFPASDGLGEGSSVFDMGPSVQIQSSQQIEPESSQVRGPAVTMSQPAPGMFGDRKKKKKNKRKSGFR